MQNYVQSMANIFHGFRINNAHEVPINVAEYLIRKARNVNNLLIVFAELTTNSESADATYCKKIGINSIIRTNNLCKNED